MVFERDSQKQRLQKCNTTQNVVVTQSNQENWNYSFLVRKSFMQTPDNAIRNPYLLLPPTYLAEEE
jgi:hypothetical protein